MVLPEQSGRTLRLSARQWDTTKGLRRQLRPFVPRNIQSLLERLNGIQVSGLLIGLSRIEHDFDQLPLLVVGSEGMSHRLTIKFNLGRIVGIGIQDELEAIVRIIPLPFRFHSFYYLFFGRQHDVADDPLPVRTVNLNGDHHVSIWNGRLRHRVTIRHIDGSDPLVSPIPNQRKGTSCRPPT